MLQALWLSAAMERVSNAKAHEFEVNGDFVFSMSEAECEAAIGLIRSQQHKCRRDLVASGLISVNSLPPAPPFTVCTSTAWRANCWRSPRLWPSTWLHMSHCQSCLRHGNAKPETEPYRGLSRARTINHGKSNGLPTALYGAICR